ncbi:hypothetical protein [Fervidicella metallireducens]|uniref:hypothetical protein n=1 Tax=Fervidicella metallireducens TaxID=655338 RepID=UPI0012691B78|nr:hypothetical protein [Fervidicella metallireducens]
MSTTIVFAATYRLQPEKIPNKPEAFFEMRDTNKNLYDRTYNSFYYWNTNSGQIVKLQQDKDRLNIDYSQKYQIYTWSLP